MDGYLYEAPVELRFSDLDALGHVNNAVVVTYLEVARARLWQEHFGVIRPSDFPFVLGRVVVDYKRPILLGEEVRIGVRLSRLGGASFTLQYRIEANGLLAAEAETVQVHLDAARVRPAPLPEELRRSLQQVLGPPPAAG